MLLAVLARRKITLKREKAVASRCVRTPEIRTA